MRRKEKEKKETVDGTKPRKKKTKRGNEENKLRKLMSKGKKRKR